MIQDSERVVRWYREQLRSFGGDLRGGGFAQAQRTRFEVFARVGDLDGKSVLDVTCGRGDFYEYLLETGRKPLYTGVDISPELLETARARFRSDRACRFETGSVLDYQPASPYDYVIASGFFGLKTETGVSIMSHTLTRLFSWSTVGAAVNFLSLRSFGSAARGHRADPAGTLKTALRLTPAVRLVHDYLPDDFTVFLYRTPAWEAERLSRSSP